MAGLLVFLPVAGTVWVLKFLVVWADDILHMLLPRILHPEILFGFGIPGLGIVFTLALILAIGALTRFYLGKKFLSLGDQVFGKIPLGKTIYSGIKQLLASTIGSDKQAFRRVVLVPWPNEFTYVIGFVTGQASKAIQDEMGQVLFNVFIPTTPNPTSGYLIMVPQERMRPVNLSVEEAIKLVISGGSATNAVAKSASHESASHV